MYTQRAQENKNILVIEKHPFTASLIKEVLENAGYPSVDLLGSSSEVELLLAQHVYSLILLSDHLDGVNSLDLLRRIISKNPKVPVVVTANTPTVEFSVEALRNGAFDILQKPLHSEKVALTVNRALECGSIRTEVIRLQQADSTDNQYYGLIGVSPPIRKVFELIERIKASTVNVLITGPSGSGKEMVARAIHHSSPRTAQKFVAINCSAIPDALLEGELFGYKKGAFTDARTDKVGLFQEAHGGTLFLDEIGDMPLTLQPKILRAIQEREIRPLGALKSVQVDVRIIAATNQDLVGKMEQKHFRDDLYYRLDTMKVHLPCLAERPDDIPLMVDFFIERFRKKNNHPIKGISQKAMKLLCSYSWPGNVRELENVIERAAVLARSENILPEDLLFSKEEKTSLPIAQWAIERRRLEDVEKEYILEILNAVGGNRSETAQILGIGRKTLYNKLAKYGI